MLNKKFKLNFIALTVAYALTPYTEAYRSRVSEKRCGLSNIS